MKTELYYNNTDRKYPLCLIHKLEELDDNLEKCSVFKSFSSFRLLGIIQRYFKLYQQQCRDEGVYVPKNRRYSFWFNSVFRGFGTLEESNEFILLQKEIYRFRNTLPQGDTAL